MKQPFTETTATTTFVVRFWCEWTGAESRWRGRIEHVQSGRRKEFLGVEELLGFLGQFGIRAGADASPASRGTTCGADAGDSDDPASHKRGEP